MSRQTARPAPPRPGRLGVWGSCFVVVVLSGLLAWVDVGWGYEPGDAVFEVDVPLFFVDEVVVVG
ncbi:MAG TPA: hypothetical protein VGK98_02005, partial [Arthrobacter sp.]|uniref:hypothetical protein n=1 Tax=Arthrobacter sp. TaxID=1667 RepID=UPI002F3EAA24